jgi:hypothetical protein
VDKSKKPIDLWLWIAAAVLALVLDLVPKNLASVACVIGLIFLLVLHPVWNFWWIEDYLPRRITAIMLIAGGLVFSGFHVPMDTRSNYLLSPMPISMIPPSGPSEGNKEEPSPITLPATPKAPYPTREKMVLPAKAPSETNRPSSTSKPKAPIKPKPQGATEAPPPVPLPNKLVQLSAVFKNPSSLLLTAFNPSDDVVENVSWGMVAIRTSDLAYFGFATQSIGYIKPHMESANYFMELETIPKNTDGNGQIKEGDELTGSVSIDCPKCTIRTYIVHFVWKRGGWYFESPLKGGYIFPKDPSKEGRGKYIQELTGEQYANQRIEIRPQ